MKKNIFEKFGLVESVGSDEKPEDINIEKIIVASETAPVEPINVKGLVTVDLIYENAGLSDLSKSIFKVEEMKAALPENLPEATKKASIIGLLSVIRLNLEEVLEDANKRINELTGTLETFSEETVAVLSKNNEKIEGFKQQIEELEVSNEVRKKQQEQQESVIKDETKKINHIVNFLK